MFERLFARSLAGPHEGPRVRGRRARLPDGVRLYAIGDIHGRVDLLRHIEELILADLAATSRLVSPLVVYLGDFVDRGFQSRATIEELIANERLAGIPRVLLRGNHDLWFARFARGEAVGGSWLEYGGDATLLSYGVRLRFDLPEDQRLAEARKELAARVPADHLRFLERLELAFSLGDYFFCHAGIRPNVPLAAQQPEDLLWIREPFLSWNGETSKVVVHGHTVSDAPVVRHNRIGVDTGACFTGVLTCLVLEGEEWRFLATEGGE